MNRRRRAIATPKPPATCRHRVRAFWREWLRPVIVMVIVSCAIRSALADWNDVPTGSMKPTILEGDRIWVNKLAYDLKLPFTTRHLAEWGGPQRGEVVVFISPADEARLVKRVVGLPGDTVSLADNHLLINGEPVRYGPLAEKFIAEIAAAQQPEHEFAAEQLGDRKHPVMLTPRQGAMRSFGPVTVPAGHYFMMGDSRDNSFDSRYFGFVERRRILGQATSVALSLDPARHYAPRWHRWFTALP